MITDVIREYIDASTAAGTPFVRTKTVDQILASIVRYAERTAQVYGSK